MAKRQQRAGQTSRGGKANSGEAMVHVEDMAYRITMLSTVKLAHAKPQDETEVDGETVYRLYDPVKGFDYFVAEYLLGLTPTKALRQTLTTVRKITGDGYWSKPLAAGRNELVGYWLILPAPDVVLQALNKLARDYCNRTLNLGEYGRGWVLMAGDDRARVDDPPHRHLTVLLPDSNNASNAKVTGFRFDLNPDDQALRVESLQELHDRQRQQRREAAASAA